MLEEIVKGRVALCDGTRGHFRDVLDHLLRVDSQADEHDELLTSALSAHLALVGRDQNKVMVVAVIVVHRLLRKSGWP
ncbi:hypothetical protein [Nonomuraea diastatica]|uniref:hypothetical protein n=1 Tax=Nonomuraea diastatica TaxID=1848329 RepID=UPI001FEABBEA|nr:hypothetical protein [Nonomuraea diastatica]